MPYVERLNGKVIGLYLNLQPGYAEEFLDENHPHVFAYRNPVPAPIIAFPALFATAGIVLIDGIVTILELAPGVASAYYEDGWITFAFTSPQDNANYLIFVQTDVPAKVEQFKDTGSFELVFSDPVTGDPIEPGRIDLQLLKVTG